VTSHGTLEVSLHEVPIPVPSANEVLVRVEASPINPSDLGLLLAGADMTTAHVAGTPQRPVITASLTEDMLRALSARVDRSLPVGNEGAGTVVAAGSSSTAQALLGKTVAIADGSMYAQHRAVDAAACQGPRRARRLAEGLEHSAGRRGMDHHRRRSTALVYERTERLFGAGRPRTKLRRPS
jgi:NADPH2:quinone reductase